MKKIFIVCPRLCYGGAERVGVMLANGFASMGDEVTMVANLFDDVTYHINEGVHVLNLVKTNNKALKWASSIFLLRKYIKGNKPDVIIGIMETCSLVAKLASFGIRIPIISTEHDSFEKPQSAPMSLKEKLFKFYVNKLYRCVTVLTEADKKVIGNRLKNVHVMPNPLSLHPVQLEVVGKRKIILAAGRIDDWYYKGFDILIQAWGKIADKYPEWKLEVAGKDSNGSSEYLKKLCVDNHVFNRIAFLGFRKDIDALYREASVFVLSSRYEGFGLVLIEAMSQGCACVACDYKGRQGEIITNDKDGLLCEPESIDDLAHAMEKLILDDEYRKILQKNAIERADFYNVNHIISMWERLMFNLINKKS
jgi:GalNAc-alpha-(1->4)-GalNAc-alpha-(1->3)-diNAcBac-PP-undecaprenol alpha-1,4-N-acetyl-D-galactosaminyltransferase